MNFIDLEKRKNILRDYAIAVTREVGVRCKHYDAANAQERKWAQDGPVLPEFLDANKRS